ncbi:hypothetical protein [Leifsonia lichenia]
MVGLVQSAEALPGGFGLGAVLALLAFGAFFAWLPTIAAAFVCRGRQWPKYVLAVVMLGNIATFSTEPIVVVGTVAATGAAILAWLPGALRFAIRSRTAATGASLTRRWPETTADAYLWWMVAGPVGGHLFYLGRSWQGVLYCVLALLAIISIPTVMAILFAAVVGLALLLDAGRIPGWVSSAAW